MHLWARCSDEITLGDMQVTGPRYALDDDQTTEALRALLPEIRKGGHIIDILKADPPKEFAALFAENTGVS